MCIIIINNNNNMLYSSVYFQYISVWFNFLLMSRIYMYMYVFTIRLISSWFFCIEKHMYCTLNLIDKYFLLPLSPSLLSLSPHNFFSQSKRFNDQSFGPYYPASGRLLLPLLLLQQHHSTLYRPVDAKRRAGHRRSREHKWWRLVDEFEPFEFFVWRSLSLSSH